MRGTQGEREGERDIINTGTEGVMWSGSNLGVHQQNNV